MAYSFSRRRAGIGGDKKVIIQIFRRTLILFALGLFLSWFPYFNIAEGRIPGVLQRIAICYFLASWIVLYVKPGWQWVITGGLLLIHWIGLKLISVPGYGAGILDKIGNLCWYIDNQLLAGHTWKYAPAAGFDPEGVFSTLTALATTMLGVFTGNWMLSKREPGQKLIGLFVTGTFAMVLGYILTIWMPLNKNLWTSSYVVYTGGLALIFLAMCYWLIDIKGVKWVATPFVIFGSNAIFVYFLSSAVAKLLGIINVPTADRQISLHGWLYQHLFRSWASDINASLAYAIVYVLFWLGINYILYRKKIFIKV